MPQLEVKLLTEVPDFRAFVWPIQTGDSGEKYEAAGQCGS